jgi:glucose/arabinose dehydrogenase
LPSPIPLALNLNNLTGSFYGEIVARFTTTSPRGLVTLPNGDLLVGTGGGTAAFAQSGAIYIVPNAENRSPAAPSVFATLSDIGCASSAGTNTNGITFAPSTGGGTIFVGMECSVWKIPYKTGDQTASSPPTQYVTVRTGPVAPGSDGDVHHTTSVLAVGSTLYVSVGSSCNACTESDPTRGTIMKTDITSPALSLVATRVRNALALAVNPVTSTVWAGGAGQDCVVGAQCFAAQDPMYAQNGHPYEWFDPVSKHTAPVDYQWPWCEENGQTITRPDQNALTIPANVNCASMIVAPVRAPAYSTIIGATFYSAPANAPYAFPTAYQNGLFFSMHGSWHEDTNGNPVAVPEIAFVPITTADAPKYPTNWAVASPYATWAQNASGNPAPFMNGFQQSGGTRIGRPVGLAVGTGGSLFVADDYANVIYRIRPGTAPPPSAASRAPATGLRSR